MEAEDGTRALAQLERQKPDLVLLDVLMPRISGFEVCQKIRETWSMEDLPIIFLTAKTKINDLVSGLSAGGNDYLTKPFQKEELLIKLSLQLSGASRVKRHTSLLDFSTCS